MVATAQLYKWDEVVLEEVRDGISRKFISGDREMVAQITLKRGATVPTHSHESEQLTYVLTGALKFTLDGHDVTVHAGELLRIPSWMPHSAEAATKPLMQISRKRLRPMTSVKCPVSGMKIADDTR